MGIQKFPMLNEELYFRSYQEFPNHILVKSSQLCHFATWFSPQILKSTHVKMLEGLRRRLWVAQGDPHDWAFKRGIGLLKAALRGLLL